jgi:hypothetical protein
VGVHGHPLKRETAAVLGALIIIAILVVVVPVATIMSGVVVAGILGYTLKDSVEKDHEGSELVDLNT